VVAVSARDAWAVGYYGNAGKTLIVHWNGTSWTRVPSRTPRFGGLGSNLSAMAATSAHRAWAVGATGTYQYLIERWTGAARQPVHVLAPGLGPGWDLVDVTATSAHSAWGVGRSAGARTSLAVMVQLLKAASDVDNNTTWIAAGIGKAPRGGIVAVPTNFAFRAIHCNDPKMPANSRGTATYWALHAGLSASKRWAALWHSKLRQQFLRDCTGRPSRGACNRALLSG
jgi:hypothetical protein